MTGPAGLLLRTADTPFGVFGQLRMTYADASTDCWVTGEEQWLDNKPSVSCIPVGLYTCVRVQSPRFGATFEVSGVPGRSLIRFHWGNTEEDTEGCILLGRFYGAIDRVDEDTGKYLRKWGVAAPSKAAFVEWRDSLKGVQKFPLEVRWAAPGEWR